MVLLGVVIGFSFALQQAEFAKYHHEITGRDPVAGAVTFAVDPKVSSSGKDAYRIASEGEGDAVEIFADFYGNLPQRETLEAMAEPYVYHKSDGKVVGRHIGAQFYTIGQRHGLNIGGHKEPLFVIAKDSAENIVYLGEGSAHPGLFRSALYIDSKDVHWIRPDMAMTPGEERDYLVRIRYRQPLQRARLICTEGKMFIRFEQPQRGVTPGQFAAWYTPQGELQGSGTIAN